MKPLDLTLGWEQWKFSCDEAKLRPKKNRNRRKFKDEAKRVFAMAGVSTTMKASISRHCLKKAELEQDLCQQVARVLRWDHEHLHDEHRHVINESLNSDFINDFNDVINDFNDLKDVTNEDYENESEKPKLEEDKTEKEENSTDVLHSSLIDFQKKMLNKSNNETLNLDSGLMSWWLSFGNALVAKDDDHESK